MALPHIHDLVDSKTLAYHLENTPFGVMLWDEQMKLVYCSDRAASMFGYQPRHLVEGSMNLLQLVHEEDALGVAAIITEITSGRKRHNESLNRNLTKEGKVFYCQWYNSARCDEAGNVIQVLSLCQDVTTHIETEQALRKSQQQLSHAFNSAINPMWVIRMKGPNSFWFEAINIAFTTVTGWKREQVEGQPIEKIMPEASHQLVRDKYNEALTFGTIIDYVEEALHPSGIKYGEIRVIPIRAEPGEPARILGIANDITEKVYLQKKLEAEREMRSREITAAAIKGQESERSKVSRELHDNVNQVLTTVKLYLELCVDQKADAQAVLPRCVTYINNTIDEIRLLSKQLSAPSLGDMNFKETLNDLAESMRSSTQMEVAVEFRSLPFLELDGELHLALYRVAQEQLTNITRYARASVVNMAMWVSNDLLYFSIKDNGVGFDPSQKRPGIGITNMQSRVEILNGRFEVQSAPGKGTAIHIEIPVIMEDNICCARQTESNRTV